MMVEFEVDVLPAVISALVLSTVLPFGLAFSPRIRCITTLILPSMFTGKYLRPEHWASYDALHCFLYIRYRALPTVYFSCHSFLLLFKGCCWCDSIFASHNLILISSEKLWKLKGVLSMFSLCGQLLLAHCVGNSCNSYSQSLPFQYSRQGSGVTAGVHVGDCE